VHTLSKHEMDVIDAAQPLLLETPGTEVLGVVFRTDPSFVQAVVPRPLRPAKDPTGHVMVTHYPTTSLGFGFNEAAVSVEADYRGETGQYLLTMLLDDDIPLIAGRETAGNPKKLAEQISLTRDQETVAGSVVRKGHEIIGVEAELTGDADPADLGEATTDLHGGR
jgi:acetoacetate decarboxylase